MSRPFVQKFMVFTLLSSSLIVGQCFARSQTSDVHKAKAKPQGVQTYVKKVDVKVNTRASKATTQELGGENRYLTFISTDKPIYRGGEEVYVRGVMLDASTHKPFPAGQTATANIEIRGPKGDTVAGGTTSAEDSVWAFSWKVPAQQAGGEYTARVVYPVNGYAPAERKFDVRDYRAPRLKSQITFMRDGYGPGEKVIATLDVKRAEGGVPEGAKVNINARIDGIEVDGGTAKVDPRGLCTVSFDLPREIPRGEGTLTLAIEDGGVVETAAKTIPILLQTVDLQMFPEGGDLVAGYKNRVYLQAKQPNGKPADLTATLMTPDGPVMEFRTEHEGRGRFEFTPEPNTNYYLTITKPEGIRTRYPLPKPKTEGALIYSEADIFEKGQPITVKVGCTQRDYRVTISQREVELAQRKPNIYGKNLNKLNPVTFDVPPEIEGVLTVTVWDKNGMPLAERLVFRQPAKPLNVTITQDKKPYVPGDNAKVTIKTTDADGKPVSTVVGVTVTDDTVLELVEKRDQAPRLPVMLFLEPEVKDLADAHVYLDPKNPKAPLATDLLLGTQGWRRFALIDINKFLKENGDYARRVVAFKTPVRIGQIGPNGEVGAPAQPGIAIGALSGGKRGQGRGAWSGTAIGAGLGNPKPVLRKDRKQHENERKQGLRLPEEIGRVEGPRDTNLFQVEPTVIDERHYTTGRAERHQKTSPTLPEGAPIPDSDAPAPIGQLQQLNCVDRYTFFPGISGNRPALNNMVVVREFVHNVRGNRQPTDRVDFTETLYWNAGIKTDPTTGEATINFGLNDSVTTFRVIADAFSSSGSVGAASTGVESVQPFYTEAKLPLEVTAGDRILLPINLVNATQNKLASANASIDLKGDFKLLDLQKQTTDITSGERLRWIQPVEVGGDNGESEMVLTAKAGAYSDKVSRKLRVKPMGYPVEVAFGGILEPGKSATHKIVIPREIAHKSLRSATSIYPTPLANMTSALERLIQEPSGCFEQTSSTSYPLTMAQQYFLSHVGVDPKLIETSREKLENGYKKLVGFWCPDRGYEWFGENPGHEALTAFGLLHFTDMETVLEVDKNMIATTRIWLLKQKDGNGGFTRKRRALHTWSEDKDCSNAYILWALLESGQPIKDLKPELDSLRANASKSQNAYVQALAANVFALAGERAESVKLMDMLASRQKDDGRVDGIKCSIVGSGGESLEIEGTSLATLAWLRDPKYASNVEKSIKFLADSCKAGRYGTTQSTVLALRTIVTYDKLRAHPRAPGKVRAYIDGMPVSNWTAFQSDMQGAIQLPDLKDFLTPGEHKLELRMEGGSPMPYSMAVTYNNLLPDSSSNCKLGIQVELAKDRVDEGNSTEANVMVTNKTNAVIPNPVAIVGLPGGLEPRHQQLKELVKKGLIAAYEVRGREVVLYWRSLDANANVSVPLSLIGAVPGSYTGPASRAYLYYDDADKQWAKGLHVDIVAKEPTTRETANLTR